LTNQTVNVVLRVFYSDIVIVHQIVHYLAQITCTRRVFKTAGNKRLRLLVHGINQQESSTGLENFILE